MKKQYIQPLTEAIEMELCEMIAVSGVSTNADFVWEDDMEDVDR